MPDTATAEYKVLAYLANQRWVEVPYSSVEYDLEPIDIKTRPMALVVVPNQSGEWTGRIKAGTEIKILRNGEPDFLGIVEPTKHTKSVGKNAEIAIRAKHKAWTLLEAEVCDDYDYTEVGSGLADVIVNPWEWRIFRDTTQALTDVGEHPAIAGFTIDKVCKALIGTKLLHQNFMLDASFFLPSTITASGAGVGVYADSRQTQLEPRLQLNRDAATGNLKSTGYVESVPIYNGDPNVTEGGTISNVKITVYGNTHVTNASITKVYACRNATSTRTYTQLTQTSTGTSGSYSYSVFEANLSADGASTTTRLGYKIDLTASGSNTPSIAYIQLEADTVSDTGITDGYIETYADLSGQDGGNTLGDGRNFMELSVFGKTRLDALADVQGMTVSRPSTNLSPHWDIHLTSGLELNFMERRGTDRPRVYSFGDTPGRLRMIDHEFEGDQIYYQVFALGAGSDIARTKIVSKAEFDKGGLYFSELDPTTGAKYGKAAKIGIYDDNNIASTTNLLRRARAFAKLHSEPISVYKIEVEPEFIDYFTVGDTIIIDDETTDTHNERIRVVSLSRKVSAGQIESWKVELGQPQMHVGTSVVGLQGQILAVNNVAQPEVQLSNASSDYLQLTSTRPGIFTFNVTDPQDGDRWLMSVKTAPWQISSNGFSQIASSTITETQTSASIASGSTASTLFFNTPFVGGTTGYYVNVRINPSGTTTQQLVHVYITNTSAATIFFDGNILLGEKTGGADQTHVGFFVGSEFTGDSVWVTISNLGLTTTSYEIRVKSTPFTGNPNFGVWQFDGDSGTGAAAPVFGDKVQMWVDPDAFTTLGAPTGASRGKVNNGLGVAATSEYLNYVDITPYMKRDANNIIKAGTHEIRFLTTGSSTNNAQGLAAIRVEVGQQVRK